MVRIFRSVVLDTLHGHEQYCEGRDDKWEMLALARQTVEFQLFQNIFHQLESQLRKDWAELTPDEAGRDVFIVNTTIEEVVDDVARALRWDDLSIAADVNKDEQFERVAEKLLFV
jgi:hypothetical protein